MKISILSVVFFICFIICLFLSDYERMSNGYYYKSVDCLTAVFAILVGLDLIINNVNAGSDN